jgi:hypothetical protein
MPGMTAPAPDLQTARMWFDPICPWAWMTSRWLLQVEQVRPVRVQWQVMSLAMLNAGRELSPEYAALMERAWGPVRVIIAAQEASATDPGLGDDVVKRLYDAMGTRIHVHGRYAADGHYDGVIAESLAECALPAQLAQAAGDERHDTALRRSHEAGIGLVGTEVGTPIVAFGEIAFFGPVVSPAPKGAAAGLLWDGCLLVAGTPGFFELKRTRTVEPIFD